MKHEQLQLSFDIPIEPIIKSVTDPNWDELEAKSDIVDDAFFAVDVKSEIFDIDALVAPQQNQRVGAQPSFDESPYTCVGAQVISDTKKSAPQHDAKLYGRSTDENPTHWVEKYWVERVGNKYWYYRYCWMEGRKKNRIYIGAVRSPKANLKKQAVSEAILDGQSSQEIKELIQNFKSQISKTQCPIPNVQW